MSVPPISGAGSAQSSSRQDADKIAAICGVGVDVFGRVHGFGRLSRSLFERHIARALAIQRSFGSANPHSVVGDTSIGEARVCTPAAVDGECRRHRH
jgi:hypothetical protein